MGEIARTIDTEQIAQLKKKRAEFGFPLRDLILSRMGQALRKVQTAAQGNSQPQTQNTPPPLTIEEEEFALKERLNQLEKERLANARQNIAVDET